MDNKYLPLGSVVLLKDGTKGLMIYGRKQKHFESGKSYDYVACLYPEGNIGDEHTYLFDHTQIAEVVHIGYSNDEDKKFVTEYL